MECVFKFKILQKERRRFLPFLWEFFSFLSYSLIFTYYFLIIYLDLLFLYLLFHSVSYVIIFLISSFSNLPFSIFLNLGIWLTIFPLLLFPSKTNLRSTSVGRGNIRGRSQKRSHSMRSYDGLKFRDFRDR